MGNFRTAWQPYTAQHLMPYASPPCSAAAHHLHGFSLSLVLFLLCLEPLKQCTMHHTHPRSKLIGQRLSISLVQRLNLIGPSNLQVILPKIFSIFCVPNQATRAPCDEFIDQFTMTLIPGSMSRPEMQLLRIACFFSFQHLPAVLFCKVPVDQRCGLLH